MNDNKVFELINFNLQHPYNIIIFLPKSIKLNFFFQFYRNSKKAIKKQRTHDVT